MNSEEVLAVNGAEFGEEISGESAVLVDFWAPWCGPCKMLTPIINEVAKDFSGQVKVRKLNVDEHPEISAKYGVRGIPTLILFKEGKVEATKVGMLSKIQLTQFLNENL